METPISRRYEALDGYRFVAATGVVLFHYDPEFNLHLAGHVPAVARMYSFVDFFFILSGFVIATNYQRKMGSWTDYIRYLRARLARIYPLHLATLALSLTFVGLGVMLSVPVNHPEIVALSNLPANVLLVHAWGVLDHLSFDTPSWSISAELFVYILAPFLFMLATRLHIVMNAMLIVLFVIAMSEVRRRFGLGYWHHATFDFGMARAVPTFFAGILIAQVVSKAPVSWTPSWWSVHALFVASIVLLGTSTPHEVVFVVFVLVIVLAALAERRGAPSVMRSRFMTSLGNASYGVYLLNSLLCVPVVFVLRRLHLIDTGWTFLAAITTYVGVVLVSLVSYRYFESPARRLLGPARREPAIRDGGPPLKSHELRPEYSGSRS